MRIWPRYDGSVSASGYPTIAVLKTTSPETHTSAPKERPRKHVPSSSTSLALRRANMSIASSLVRRCIFPAPESGVVDPPLRLQPYLSPCSTGEGGMMHDARLMRPPSPFVSTSRLFGEAMLSTGRGVCVPPQGRVDIHDPKPTQRGAHAGFSRLGFPDGGKSGSTQTTEETTLGTCFIVFI